MQAVIYARVSKEEQLTNYSPGSQLAACRKYASDHNFEIVGEYLDAHTGTELSRPEFNKVKQLAGKVDAVIVYTQDRLGRAEELDTWNLIRSFQDKGTQVHTTDSGFIDTRDFIKSLEMIFKARSSREERDKFIERSSRGKRERAKSGKVMMPKSVSKYGYRYQDGALTIFEPEAAIVRKIFGWYTKGDETRQRIGLNVIAGKLTDMAEPTRRDVAGYGKSKRGHGVWGHEGVHDIISDETYCGVWYYNRHNPNGTLKDRAEWIPVTVPAIVSRETWEAAQRIAKENRRDARRNSKNEALMYARIECSRCGMRLSGTRDYRYDTFHYGCNGQRKSYAPDGKNPTCQGGFDMRLTDDLIWRTVAEILKNPESLLTEYRERQARRESDLQEDRDYLARCEAKIQECDEQINHLLRLYLEKRWEVERLDNERALIDLERAKWQAKRDDLASRLAETDADQTQFESFTGFCADHCEGIELFTFEEKRAVIEILDIRAVVHRNEAVKRQRKARGTGSITLTGYFPGSITVESDAGVVLPEH